MATFHSRMAGRVRFAAFCLVLLAVLMAEAKENTRPESVAAPRPTHADAALVLAKYSGLFDRYIAQEATLDECVAFLNRSGIYFGLMEIINGREFTQKDCARVMGQIDLVFSGEAEYLAGKARLPEGMASWEEFCLLNDVKYVEAYEAIVASLRISREIRM